MKTEQGLACRDNLIILLQWWIMMSLFVLFLPMCISRWNGLQNLAYYDLLSIQKYPQKHTQSIDDVFLFLPTGKRSLTVWLLTVKQKESSGSPHQWKMGESRSNRTLIMSVLELSLWTMEHSGSPLTPDLNDTTANESLLWGLGAPLPSAPSRQLGTLPNSQTRFKDLSGIFFMVTLNVVALLANTAVLVVVVKAPHLRYFGTFFIWPFKNIIQPQLLIIKDNTQVNTMHNQEE